MPEEDPQSAAPATGTEPAATTETAPPAKDWEAEAKKWQALSRKNEDQAKANADAAKRLKEIEDSNLSEIEKAQRARDEAIAERDRIKSEAGQLLASALRDRVAVEKEVPAALVGRLQGSTFEELAADADALMALVHSPRTPQPDLSQGVRGEGTKTADDVLYEQYLAVVNKSNNS